MKLEPFVSAKVIDKNKHEIELLDQYNRKYLRHDVMYELDYPVYEENFKYNVDYNIIVYRLPKMVNISKFKVETKDEILAAWLAFDGEQHGLAFLSSGELNFRKKNLVLTEKHTKFSTIDLVIYSKDTIELSVYTNDDTNDDDILDNEVDTDWIHDPHQSTISSYNNIIIIKDDRPKHYTYTNGKYGINDLPKITFDNV